MPRIAVIPTARPTFVVDVARQRAQAARALIVDVIADLGGDVIGPDDLVMTPEDVKEAAAFLDSSVDLVVHVCASFSDASPAVELNADLQRPVLLWAFREPGPVGDRLWLNSLCGANLVGHAMRRAGSEVRLVYGDPDEPRVRDVLARALAGELPAAPTLPSDQRPRGSEALAQTAIESLRGRSIGVIGDAPPGFTPSEFDPAVLRDVFGLEITAVDVDATFDRVAAVEPAAVERELADATRARPTLARLDQLEVRRHAAVTSALRQWATEQSVAAAAVRCWPEFPTQLGICPCSSLSRLADEGLPTQCERDVYGAVTMLLLEALGSGTTYLVDTVDLDADSNLVRLWHCGSAATSLAADPSAADQYVHCNRKIGVAGNFPLRTGPVIMARLTEDVDRDHGSGLRLLIASGESVPAPNRFQGNTADVRLDSDAATFVHGLVTGGFPHHTVLAWTDVRPQLRAAADLLDIPVIEW